jgi:hypothetical protein
MTASAAVAPAQEMKFYDAPGIVVTNSRFIVGQQTFAMQGVTSVSSFSESPSFKGPIITIIVGLLILLGGLAQGSQGIPGLVFGAVVIALGIWWLRSRKPTFHVLLRSSSGEQKPLSSKDQHLIGDVVKALNDSIVYRR